VHEPGCRLARLWAGYRRVLDQRRGASGPQDDESGLHLCFSAPTRRSVDAFHAAALAAGGRDNGAPGVRADYGANYYAAFVVDPDGYRIEAYCGRAEP
jgi:catechol 2,3-dioxygenase-like lactoylglutathione lyase family enzyme